MAEIYGFAINIEGNAVKGITAIDQNLNKLGATATKSTESIFGGFIKANIAMRAFDYGVAGMKSVYNLGVQTEQTRIAFDTMLGSAEKGGAMFQSLKQWADVTPFDNDTAYQAGKMLLNYGVSAQEVLPYMNMLGDASGGVKERFDRMIYAFAQVRAMGRLQGQDLRQLIDAGFNPLQTISEKTGQSMSSLKEKMEKGQISFNMVVDAFKSATGEGGRFFGMMQSQSQTVGGLWSTLVGSSQTAAYGMFQAFSPTLKEIYKGAIDVSKAFADWVTPKQSDILATQNTELMAQFEVLKKGNLPLDQRRELIAGINGQYKDYLPQLLTEKMTVGELAKVQEIANQTLLNKIKIQVQQEQIQEYTKPLASAVKAYMGAQIKYEEGKANPGKLEGSVLGAEQELFVRKGMVDKTFKDYAVAKAQFAKNMEAITNLFSMDDLNKKGLSKTVSDIQSGIKYEATKTSPQSVFTENATSTSEMGKAGGGLGEAKQIHIRIDKLMEVNAQAYTGEDIQQDATKAVEEITRIIKNMSYGQGLM